MRDSEIRDRLKRAIDEAPIDMLDDLLNTYVEKMAEHDEITEQFPRTYTLPIEEKKVTKKKTNPSIFRYVAMAASLAFMIFAGNNYYQNMLIGSLFLDVNPSIRLDVQRNDKVKDVVALNDDGSLIMEDIKVKNMDVSEAVISILSAYEEAGYIISGEEVILLTSQLDGDIRDKVIAEILDHYVKKNITPTLLTQDVDDDEDVLTGKSTLARHIIQNEIEADESVYNMNLKEMVQYTVEHDIDLNKYADVYGDLKKYEKEEVIEEIVPPPVIEAPVEVAPPPPVHVPAPKPTPPPVYYDDDDSDYGDDWDDDSDYDDWDDDSDYD